MEQLKHTSGQSDGGHHQSHLSVGKIESFAIKYPRSPIHVTERMRTEFKDDNQDIKLRNATRQSVQI